MKRDRWQDSSDEEEDSTRKTSASLNKNVEKRPVEANKNQTIVKTQPLTNNKIISTESNLKEENHINSISSKPVSSPSPSTTVTQSSSSSSSSSIQIKTQKDQGLNDNEEYNPAIYGCRSVEEYEKVSYISQGTYGLVFKARCVRSNELVALKEIKMTSDARKVGFPITALREINILLALRHPNIIRVREMVIGSTLDRVFMVMDYYDFDLKTCMDMSTQSFSTAEAKQLMLQLLAGIHHMHSNWFLHRDLKTSNILYANTGTLCICDFGMARKFGRSVHFHCLLLVYIYMCVCKFSQILIL